MFLVFVRQKKKIRNESLVNQRLQRDSHKPYRRDIIGIIIHTRVYQEMKAGHFKRRVFYSLRLVQETSTTFLTFVLFHMIIGTHFIVSLKKVANISDK